MRHFTSIQHRVGVAPDFSHGLLISEHQQKLADYIDNPDAFDDQGLLQGASEERRAKIIAGRIAALEKQISKQERELQKILDELEMRAE